MRGFPIQEGAPSPEHRQRAPAIQGVETTVSTNPVELSVLLMTVTGDQWAAERALLTQITTRFEHEQRPLAQGRGMASH